MMDESLYDQRIVRLSVANKAHHDNLYKLGVALSSHDRLNILEQLLHFPKNISTLSNELAIPVSSVSRHVEILADAGLINVYYQPGLKGRRKYSAQHIQEYIVSLAVFDPQPKEKTRKEYSIELPVGLFSHCHIQEPCGMLSKTKPIGIFDCPDVFFSPERVQAEILWFSSGFISYNFPTTHLRSHKCSEISFSFEICSEVQYFNTNWPSDITVYINDIEIITFTSPGDFGGRRGKYTPKFWPVSSTQYGLLKKITVNERGVFLDNLFLDDKIKFEDLKLLNGYAIKLTIGVKEDAVHRGGINLFGKNFGDHPQAIIMTVR